ncbi:cytochrome C oxidase subunit IV family protein (plasmid) [Halorussus salilacus]|uniref:cytochrome C oxidase subunit IV family protein n=1 Tax=Halorussus salilacus TaxID=2953750 RepID=UPI00209FC9B5|nr:cytochrome C oxidase subunit IV family protein [Halorussus salilacus]USZ69832.1 cytochrome C oxidase subunit IV family protein [Halorussus salilacus]
MARTKLYAGIYVVLFVMATAQTLVEFADLDYWTGFWIIIALSFAKAVIVAAYYQHLRWEPRSITYVVATGLLAALALTIAASYSIL